MHIHFYFQKSGELVWAFPVSCNLSRWRLYRRTTLDCCSIPERERLKLKHFCSFFFFFFKCVFVVKLMLMTVKYSLQWRVTIRAPLHILVLYLYTMFTTCDFSRTGSIHSHQEMKQAWVHFNMCFLLFQIFKNSPIYHIIKYYRQTFLKCTQA